MGQSALEITCQPGSTLATRRGGRAVQRRRRLSNAAALLLGSCVEHLFAEQSGPIRTASAASM